MNVWVTHSAVISLHSFSITFLLRQSVIISRFVQPSLDSKSITKSMNISCQILSDTDKGFKKLCWQSFQLLFIQHLSQFWQNVQMFCNISDQKNCYDKRTSIMFLFECLTIVESCVYWISSVWRNSKFSTQCLSQKSNFSLLFRNHSVMNTLILSVMSWTHTKVLWSSCLLRP